MHKSNIYSTSNYLKYSELYQLNIFCCFFDDTIVGCAQESIEAITGQAVLEYLTQRDNMAKDLSDRQGFTSW